MSHNESEVNLNELAKDIHENAVAHGWWEEKRSFGDIIALCHSELSEALEEYRAGRPMEWYACLEDTDCESSDFPCNPVNEYDCINYEQKSTCEYRGKKPEGIAVEMVDCVIRIFDFLAHEGIDIDGVLKRKHEFNKSRSYKHGGKVM